MLLSHKICIILIINFIELIKFSYSACDKNKCNKIIEKCILKKQCICNTTNITSNLTSDDSNINEINDLNKNLEQILNCKHSKNCFNCMENLFIDCCDCIGYCTTKYKNLNENIILKNNLSKLSNIGNFNGHEKLFLALIKDPDDVNDDWTVYTFPIGKHLKFNQQQQQQQQQPSKSLSRECSVLFHKECLSLNKCQRNCESFGAFGYRWFHNGCCECVGPNCINYGINESNCKNCAKYVKEDNSINKMNEIDDEL